MYKDEKAAFDLILSKGFKPEEGPKGLGWVQIPEDGPTDSETMRMVSFLMKKYGYGPIYRKSFPAPPDWPPTSA